MAVPTAVPKRGGKRYQQMVDSMELVPNKPFREWWERRQRQEDPPSVSQVCFIAGWTKRKNNRANGETYISADTTYFMRLMGYMANAGSNKVHKSGKKVYHAGDIREHIPYDIAVELADAMGADYHEVGV